MSRHKMSPAEYCWLGLGIYILAADVYLWRTEKDTMSIQFSHWLDSRPGKVWCLLATGGMVSHLWIGVPLPLQARARKYLGGRKNGDLASINSNGTI